MSNDDLIPTLPDSNEDEKTTQPTITAVFRLLRELEKGQKGLNTRIDEVENRFNTRLDEVESRLAREIAGVNTRLVEMSDEMKSGFLQLADKIDRSRLHTEAD